MSWSQTFRETPLSFRNVRILWSSSTLKGGFNNDKSIYPGLEGWNIQQISQIPDSFSIEGKITGEDYLEQKALLLGALQTPGPGTLIIPGLGTLEVFVASYTLKEQVSKKGLVEVSISFERPTPEKATFEETPPVEISYKEENRQTLERLIGEGTDLYSPSLYLEFKRGIGAIFSSLMSISALLQGKTSPLSQLLFDLDQAQAKLDTLASQPAQLATSLLEIMDSITSLIKSSSPSALVEPTRGALLYFRRAAEFTITPGTDDQGKGLAVTQNTTTAQKVYHHLAFYTYHGLLRNFTPLSKDDAADQVGVLTRLYSAAETQSPQDNELLAAMRTHTIKTLYHKLKSGGLQRETTTILAEANNLLSLSHAWDNSPQVIRQLNAVENGFFIKGRIRHV